MNSERISVYIDGCNFYHDIKNKIKRGICCYPSLRQLCENKLEKINGQKPTNVKINYFTALVFRTKSDYDKRHRQDCYNNALKAEDVKVRLGEYVPRRKFGKIVYVEKYTDVNLAVEMVNDAWLDIYDRAILISRDADFRGAIQIVQTPFRSPFFEKSKKVVDVWAAGPIPNIPKDIREIVNKSFTITNKELQVVDQIANFDFDPKDGGDMP